MEKKFIVITFMALLVGCGEKLVGCGEISFKEIQNEVNSRASIKDKIEAEGRYNKEDSKRLRNVDGNLLVELEKEEKKGLKKEQGKRKMKEDKIK